jgi:hypothetical protein
VIDRLTRITTALAVVAVASVAAIISYQHAYELVRTHGESGLTARLLPFTVDGLIWAASMVVRAAHAAGQERQPRDSRGLPGRSRAELCADDRRVGTVTAPVRHQPAGHRPRTEHRPPQSQARARPSWITLASWSQARRPS